MSYKSRFKTAKIFRIASQILFFLLLIYIYIRSLDPFNILFNPFLKYDPLIFLTHSKIKFLFPVLLILLLTLIFGRFFCGWVCPLGFLIDTIDLALKPFRNLYSRIIKIKISGKLLQKLNLFPPSWFILGLAIVSIFTSFPILQFTHPNIWILRIFSLKKAGLIFLGLLFIFSLFKNRFWCRYLCPLGALYGLLSKFSLFKLKILNCHACGICNSCPMGAIDYELQSIQYHQCILCFNHEYKCPASGFKYSPAVIFKFDYNPERREFLKQSLLLTSGLAMGGILSLTNTAEANTKLLRPPGVKNETDFVKRCLRCFQCVKSCPNNIIKITTLEGGFPSLLTPHLEFDEYGCDYNCQVCQIVCPNYAIPLQTLKEKQHTKIGTAKIYRELCVVYAKNIDCIVCEEFCPTTPKAVLLDIKETTLKNGEIVKLKYPRVDKNLCIGCGICEANCPADQKAIKVYKSV